MSEKKNPPSGRFVWHDMMTTDLDASIGFYTKLLGWKIEEVDMGGPIGKYRMIKAGDQSIGGFVPIEKEAGAPSHWMSYVTTDNLDRCLDRVKTLGGEVCVPPTEIPDTGHFAVITDPTGGAISPFESSGDPMPEPTGPPPFGHFCWDELLAMDTSEAERFYTGVFGWRPNVMEFGPAGKYHVMMRGEAMAAGIMQKPPDAPPPSAWLSYIHVESVDAYTKEAQDLGAKLMVQPSDIPSVGRFSVLQDPAGAYFALFQGLQG